MRKQGYFVLGVLLIGLLSLYLAYHLWTSDAWFYGFGSHGTHYENIGATLEGIRILFIALCFFVIARFILPVASRYAWQGSVLPRRLFHWTGSSISHVAAVLWFAGIIVLPIYHIWWAPEMLKSDFADILNEVSLPEISSLARYHIPHILYLPYSLGTYVLLAIPLMLMTLISIKHDRHKLNNLLQGLQVPETTACSQHALHLKTRLDRIHNTLALIMNRYLAILALVALYYAIEFFTTLIETLSCFAQIVTSWSAWIFLLVIVPYFFVRTYGRFSGANKFVRRTVDNLKRKAAAKGDKECIELLEDVEERVRSDSVISYFNILRKTRVVFVLVLLGIGSGLLALIQKEDVRDTVNKVVPAPADWVVIQTIDILTPKARATGFRYELCSTAHRPPADTVYARYGKDLDE